MIYGTTGTGKTVFSLQSIANAVQGGAPGVYLSFSESIAEIRENGRSFGLDLAGLETNGRLVLDSVHLDPEELAAAGGLAPDSVFVRLEQAVERIGATLVVIDAINVLSQTIANTATSRAEIRRLLDALKRRGVTTIITVEVSKAATFRSEEFLADCVVQLRTEMVKGIATRRLRVVKYRGSDHRLNAYPFVITDKGVVVTPIIDDALDMPSSSERISLGIPGLDKMLRGGVFRGDTLFISGSAGSGKTSVTVSAAVASCLRDERCLFVGMEEPRAQIVRNMGAIGLDLTKWTERGLLRMIPPLRSVEGLEDHLVFILDQIEEFRPELVVIDPLTPLMALGEPEDVRETIIRLLSLIKARGATVACTLLAREENLEEQNTPFASFVDDIILLRNIEEGDERARSVTVLKARGTPHSTRVRSFGFSSRGLFVGEPVDPESGGGDGHKV